MNYKQERKALLNFFDDGIPSSRSLAKSTNPEIVEFVSRLKALYKFIEDIGEGTHTIGAYLYCLHNDVENHPTCVMCGNKICSILKSSKHKMFPLTCSKKCGVAMSKDARNDTNMARYGGNPNASESVITKRKNTNIKKYGVENVSQLDDVKQKKSQTSFEKYGVDHSIASKEVREAIKATSMQRYGVEHPVASEVAKTKRRSTLEGLGVTHNSHLEGMKEKRDATFKERFGGHPLSNEEVRAKGMKTSLEKYGKETYSGSDLDRSRRVEKSLSMGWGKQDIYTDDQKNLLGSYKNLKEHYDQFLTIREAALALGIPELAYGRYLASHGIEIKFVPTSGPETRIRQYIESLGFETTTERRIIDNKDIDIFVKSMKLGIEFNGSYYHSEDFRDRYYHQKKSLSAKEKGIKLIHIWEYDWNDEDKRLVILSKIDRMLGVNDCSVFARKTKVISIDNKTASKFHTKNHIQGERRAKYNFALTYEDEIVAVISLTPSNTKNTSFEITRYSTSKRVVGGFTKLLSHFKKNFEWSEIITYASLDYGYGVMYEKAGFDNCGVTPPNYKYVKGNNVISRQKAMKHKLPKLIKDFDESLTEHENMKNNGWLRIYDAGSIKFTMTNPNT